METDHLPEISERDALEGIAEAVRRGVFDPVEYCLLQWPQLHHAKHGLLLDQFQQDIIRACFDSRVREVAIKGATGVGKGTAAALCACLWWRLYPDSQTPYTGMVVISSSSWDHAAKQVLFPEVARWFGLMRDRAGGKVHQYQVTEGGPQEQQSEASQKHRILVVNPDSDEGFSGKHGALAILDEATAIADSRFAMVRKWAPKIIYLGNPRTVAGQFFDLFHSAPLGPDTTAEFDSAYGVRKVVTVDGAEVRNVQERRLERPVVPEDNYQVGRHTYGKGHVLTPHQAQQVGPIIPGQLTYDRYLEMLTGDWEEAVFAHGRFPGEDPETQLIYRDWIAAAVRAHLELGVEGIPIEACGLDIGRSASGDRSALALGGQLGCREVITWHEPDSTCTRDRVLNLLARRGVTLTRGEVPIVVDVGGLAGVGDMLRELGCKVIEDSAASVQGIDKRHYANRRASNHGQLAKRLDTGGPWAGKPWALPPDSELHKELQAPQKIYVPGQWPRYRVTPKHARTADRVVSVEQMLGRSPDAGDAVTYLWRAVEEMVQPNQLKPPAVTAGTGSDAQDTRYRDRLEQYKRRLAL